MATTQTSKEYVGTGDGVNGSDLTWTYTFQSYQKEDIKVKVTNATADFVDVTNFTIPDWTAAGGTITFDNTTATPNSDVCESSGAPKSNRTIRIYRETDVTSGVVGVIDPKATYTAGSSIKADDLNNNQKQVLYAIHELRDQERITVNVRNSAITGTKIKDDEIDSQHYAAGSIDLEHMSANSIDSDQYVDGSIDLIHMSANSVDSDQYVDGSVDLVHLSANSVDSSKIVDGSIVNADINASAAIEGSKLAASTTSVAGSMSAADKTKLDGIEASADVTDATNVNAAGAVMNSDLDVKGEILVGDGSGDPTALSVGTNDHVLTADSSTATGIAWKAASGGGGTAITIQDEGSALSTAASTINFVGSGVTASGTGTTKTITISGGGGGGGVTSDSDGNTVAGTSAGNDLDSGEGLNNTFFGKDAGANVTTGDSSVAVGEGALKVATTSSNNVAIGRNALTSNTAAETVAVGAFALGAQTTGTQNCAYGYDAGAATTTATRNTYFGYKAGDTLTTASDNTCIGNEAGHAIEYGTYNTMVGSKAGDSLSGWNGGNTCIGGLSDTQGSYNVMVGQQAGQNSTGSQSISIGVFSGKQFSGSSHVFIGYEAGKMIESGSEDICIGRGAGKGISSGSKNVLIGQDAGNTGTNDLTSGSNNILLGHDAAASSATVSNEVTIGDANVTKFRLPGLDGFQIDDNGTIDLPGAIDENVLAITDASSVALDPDLGTVQTWTLGANRTATDSLTTGQSMILMVNDGSSYTITWPTIKWLGASAAGSAPTLATSGYTCIELWKVGSDLYGALIGVSS